MTERNSQRLVCVGECMVEMAPHGSDDYAMGFAGDTLNTAWYARRLLPQTFSVGYVSCVGDDAISDRMTNFLSDQDIDVSGIRQIPEKTVGLYMIQLDNGERSFSYWRGQSAARNMADDQQALAESLKGAGVIQFSGITLAILDDEARAKFCDVIAEARANGAIVAFDTNMRPRLWDSLDAMRAGILQGAAVADIVLPSFDEEVATFGDTSQEDTIARYRDLGATTVVVKNGIEPLILWDSSAGTSSHAPVAATDVVDTTAAGDSFDAGFLSAWMQGASLAGSVKAGMTLAALVIQGKGALVQIDPAAVPAQAD